MESQLNVLLVEDDQHLRRMLARALAQEGYAVVACASGTEALDAMRQQRIDLVVTDIKMPGIDGLEALARMKRRRPDQECIVITGYSNEELSLRAVHLGVTEYMRKPFPLEVFLDAVARASNRVRARQQEKARQEALVETALWALEGGLEPRAGSGLEPSERAQLAYRAGLALGYEELCSRFLQLAVLAWARTGAAHLVPGLTLEGLPSNLREMFGPGQAMTELLAEVLSFPGGEGRFGPLLRELRRQEVDDCSDLVAVGHLCQASGQWEKALTVYQEILDRDPPPHWQVEAWLGLAQTGAMAGHTQVSREAVERAVAVSHLAGRAAQVLLEGGLILARLGLPNALGLLEQAAEIAPEGSLDRARARLALILLRGSPEEVDGPLGLLLSGANLDVLLDDAWWLLRGLLGRRDESATTRRVLGRLVRELPGQVAGLTDANRLGLEAQRRLARLLREEGCPDLLERLAQVSSFPEVREAAAQPLETQARAAPEFVRFFSLGGFEVVCGQQRLTSKEMGGKTRTLVLAAVAGANPGFISEDALCDEFWPDEEGARKRLSQAISVLRRALREAVGHELDFIEKSVAGFRLGEFPCWHDYTEILTVLDALDRTPPEAPWSTVALHQEQILRLYRGSYLSGCYMEWAMQRRNALERRVLGALLRLARQARSQGQAEQATHSADRAVELEPTDQEATLVAMEAYIELRRPEMALKRFDRCCKMLERELGLEPSIDLLRVRQKALLLG